VENGASMRRAVKPCTPQKSLREFSIPGNDSKAWLGNDRNGGKLDCSYAVEFGYGALSSARPALNVPSPDPLV
jgi:hypothetical protein